MFTATLATMTPFQVVFFGKNHQTRLVEVEIFTFNEWAGGIVYGFSDHLKYNEPGATPVANESII